MKRRRKSSSLSSSLWNGSKEWRGSSIALVTNLDQKEIKDLYTIYEKLFANCEGSKCTLEDLMSSLGSNISKRGLCKIFNVFDEEGTGNVDIKRFVVGLSACCKGKAEDRLMFCLRVFSKANKAIDGYSMKEVINSMLKILEIHSTFFTEDEVVEDDEEKMEREVPNFQRRMSIISWACKPLGVEDVKQFDIDIAEWILEAMLKETGYDEGDDVPISEVCHWMCHNQTALQFLSRMEILSKYDLVPKPQTSDEEKSIIEGLIRKASKLRLGEVRCVISYKWWKLWADYVNFYGDCPRRQSMDNSSLPILHPGVIDNSDLIERNAPDIVGPLIKQNLVENSDFIIVAQSVWDELFSWYGGGPELKRFVISDKKPRRLSMVESTRKERTATLRYSPLVELYPLLLFIQKEFSCQEDTKSLPILCSKFTTVLKLKEIVLSELKISKAEKSRLWVVNEKSEPELLQNYEQNLEDSKLFSKNRLFLETMINGEWRIQAKPFKSSKDIDKNFQGDGLVGLANLGNTCFMNSALQCMSNTLGLREYFLSDMYVKDINTTNPLGMKGELVKEFASLIKKLWSTDASSYVAPKSFKTCIGKFAQQFSGYDQQDAQELLGFLLDGLHEDLNKVIKKPYIEMKDTDDRPEEEVSAEFWENHTKRNQSIIVSLFQGQLKSVVKCKACGHRSLTFDPFTFLSLPLPNIRKRLFNVTVVFRSGRRIVFKCPISHHASFKELKISLIKVIPAKVHSEQLAFFDVTENYIFSIIKENKLIQDYSDTEKIFCFEVVKVRGPQPYTFLSLVNRIIVPNENKEAVLEPVIPILKPFPLPLQVPPSSTCLEVFKTVYKRVMAYMKPEAQLEIDLENTATYPFTLKHVNRNGSGCGRCNWADSCLGCEMDSSADFILGNNDSLALDWKSEGLLNLKEVETYNSASRTDSEGASVSVQDCMQEFSREEDLEDDSFYCSKCKQIGPALKAMELWQAPPILIVHLKRFRIDERGRTSKVNSYISFDVKDFDLKPFIASKNRNYDNLLYDLYAVVNHSGRISGGHYIAYSFNEILGKWICYDDETYSEMKESQIQSKASYLLFYKRRDVNHKSLESVASSIAASLNNSYPEQNKVQKKKSLVKWRKAPSATCSLL
eukprot:Nk52_evm30s352 gene=Nk52_evmTU30s352